MTKRRSRRVKATPSKGKRGPKEARLIITGDPGAVLDRLIHNPKPPKTPPPKPEEE